MWGEMHLMNNNRIFVALRGLRQLVGKVLFVGGFTLTPIAMGSLVQDVESWGGVYGWLVSAWDNGFRQPVLSLINPFLAWTGIAIPASAIDYLTIGGVIVSAHHRTIRAFPVVRERMHMPWIKPERPGYVRWPLEIAIWPLTLGLFYVVVAVGLMLLLLSDRLVGEGQGSTAIRGDLVKTLVAAGVFLSALSIPFVLLAFDANVR